MTAWFIVILLCAGSQACIEVTPPVAPYYDEQSCLDDGVLIFLGYRPPVGWRPESYRCEERALER